MPYDPSKIAEMIASFEDGVTQKGRPTGQATGGRSFEANLAIALGSFISQIAQELRIDPLLIRGEDENGQILKNEIYLGLSYRNRSIIWNLPSLNVSSQSKKDNQTVRYSWLARKYDVSIWYDRVLGALDNRGWVPIPEDETNYHGERYSEIYKGSQITFDGTIALIESDQLRRKIFIEAKSAKSSNKGRIDGNAHERFSYQNLEYLELATLYPSTQLLLLTNDAFVRYKNKYHTGFGVHAVRLSNAFGFYSFDMVSTKSQYVRLFNSWKSWIEGAS
ncbi:MAG: hypothetical protein KatS3mg075_369 [Meiothermus sp.]|nr:MAG: hypothetical protein KatS3mg075_369 [Meiothermus sp.]